MPRGSSARPTTATVRYCTAQCGCRRSFLWSSRDIKAVEEGTRGQKMWSEGGACVGVGRRNFDHPRPPSGGVALTSASAKTAQSVGRSWQRIKIYNCDRRAPRRLKINNKFTATTTTACGCYFVFLTLVPSKTFLIFFPPCAGASWHTRSIPTRSVT